MKQLARNLTIGSLFFGLQILGLGQSVTLSIGSGSGTAGTSVSLPINLSSSGGAQTAGLQWSFVFSSDITSVSVVAGPSATNAGKSITCSANSCLILGFNNTAMAAGTVATATFQVAANPSTTSIPVQVTGVVASTAAGDSIPASGSSGTISLPAPPPVVSVSVSPSNATLTASQTRQFTATVTGNATTSVTWSMNPSVGSLSNGLYTAPSVINSAQSVTVTATSVADSTKSASAIVQLTPAASVSVSVSPSNATLSASQTRQFTATVTGNANTAVTWSMNPSVGSLSNGLYTAPSVINSAQSVTVTATSVADSTKSASATVQLTPAASVSVSVSPSNAILSASQTRQFTATVTGNANTSVTWSMNPSVGSLSNGLYTAPPVINSTQSVTVTATSVADSTKSASATVQLTPAASVSVGVSPSSATLSVSQGMQFTATVIGNANTAVTWSVNPSVGSLSNGLYTAPSVINSAQSVTVTATSVADPTKSASATVQLTPAGSVGVGLSPLNTTLSASQSTQFTATVVGNANTAVTWSINPSLGNLSNGLYTAPSVIDSAQSVTVTATSVADPTKSASATVQLTANGVSVGLNPRSATLAASQSTQFTATVAGNANAPVAWSMNPSLGSLSNGLYTAPSVIDTPHSITITATSVADPTKSASATVQLVPTGGTPSIGTVTITSPASQPAFTTAQTIDLTGTAPANTAQVGWTTDQGIQGQANGTTTWSAKGVSLRKGYNLIKVTALDAAGNQSTMAITVVVSPTIVTTSLPDGQIGKPYSSKLAAVGGIPPLTWSAASMPSGLTLGEDGLITGTPGTDGTFTLNVTVQDSLQISTIATVKLRIDNGLTLVSAANLKPGPVAPGSMVTVFGGQLASVTQSATEQPLPTTLGGCTITITDANAVPHAAGLYYASPNQVNFVIPTDTAAGPATIAVTSADQTQTLGTLNIATVSPGLFFLNSDGLAAADLTRVNASSTSYEEIARLDTTTNLFVAVPIDLGPDTDQVYLTFYGTGLRNRPSLDSVQVLVANIPAKVDFADASATSPGLDLVRVLLPKELRGTGTATVVVTVNGISSNSVNVVIK